MTRSIIDDRKRCFVCKTTKGLHLHHVFFGKNRKKADKDGLMVYLCYDHHEGTNGVHGKYGHQLDEVLKIIAEKRWLEYYDKDVNEFIKKYGKNYL